MSDRDPYSLWGFVAIIMVAILLLTHPGIVGGFVRWTTNAAFSAINQATGGHSKSPFAPDPRPAPKPVIDPNHARDCVKNHTKCGPGTQTTPVVKKTQTKTTEDKKTG